MGFPFSLPVSLYPMVSQVLMDEALFERVVDRLAHQLLEHHDFNHSDLIGLQPRGYWLPKYCNAVCTNSFQKSTSTAEGWM